MSIGFNEVPSNLRVPWLYAEFDNSGAVSGPQLQPYITLMIGPRLAAGTKAELTKHLVTSKEQAIEYFGAGSLLSKMAAGFLKNNSTGELHCISLDDKVAGVQADGSILISGAASKAGIIKLYIGGDKVEVGVAAGEAAAAIATNLQAVLAANTELLVSSAIDGVVSEKINFLAKNKGELGNGIDIRLNYFDGDLLPSGVSATITAMANGAGNADVAPVFGILDDTQYILMPSAFVDPSNLLETETQLDARFGPMKQNDGYGFYGIKGTLSELITIGDSRNSQFTVLHRASGPIHPAVQASMKAGVVALSGQIDPARPFQTLSVSGLLAESEDEMLTLEERNILLYHGVSTDKVVGGNVVIERIITTYKKNNAGADDVSYLDLNTLLTLSYLRYDWRNYMLRKYPRHKLASDGTRFGVGQPIMTPKLGKAEAINKFIEWEQAGLVEGLDQFKTDLIVERAAGDVNRLDFMLPTNLINQLRVIGTQFKFLL